MPERAEQSTGVQLLTIDEGNDGQRLDNFLLARLKGVPKSWVYRVLRRGEVRVNKGRCKPERRLRSGDVVRVPPVRQAIRSPDQPHPAAIERIEQSIVYEDKRLLIVDKPSGVAVHGGSGVSHGVIELLRAARPAAPFLELAHRLDRETSGCLMLAKQRSALRTLQDLQRRGLIEKRYLALLSGRTRRGRWRADAPLRKNTLKGGERVVRVDAAGKVAVSHFTVETRYPDATLVEVRLETGRTHQIRVHAAAGGMPILGDTKYGDEGANRVFRARGLTRLFLHAASLRFRWPETGQEYHFEAPLSPELREILEMMDKG
jgi:23S rRNA pseudouridine955/2504/2580 synthase